MEGAYLAHSVYGFFENGGALCWVVRVGAGNGNGARPQAALPSAGDARAEAFRAEALDGIGAAVRVEVAEEQIPAPEEGKDAPEQTYRVVVDAGTAGREEFDGLSLKKGRQNIATKVNATSKLIRLEETGAALPDARPAVGTYALSAPSSSSDDIDANDFAGDVARRQAGSSRPSTRSRWSASRTS